EGHLVAGLHHPPEPRVLDPAEEGQRSRVALVDQECDRAGLREGLELEHARKDRVAGEVSREERLLAGHALPGGNRGAGLVRVDRVDETKRWPVRKKRNKFVAGVTHAS